MNYYTMMQRRPRPTSPPRKQSRPADAAFDLWLNRGLHKLYDEVAREPIPDELLKLIEESRDQEGRNK